MKTKQHTGELTEITNDLVGALRHLRFDPPVTHIYNPLEYAMAPYHEYLRRYAREKPDALFLGMNPGPFGMAQTGIPFGDVVAVREWLGIEERVIKPRREHPKRPVQGFQCQRREVSGSRFWGLARDIFKTPDRFFERFFVLNYCPLVFIASSGRNITPDKLLQREREPLFAACDEALRRTVAVLRPKVVIGVGSFAEKRARIALDALGVRVGCILHPSPASPRANGGWAEIAISQLRSLGISLPAKARSINNSATRANAKPRSCA